MEALARVDSHILDIPRQFLHLGKNFVAQHIVESLYRKGYRSKYVQVYSISRDFMHNDPHHLQQYKVWDMSVMISD